MLIYLHGFRSGPQSQKAQDLKRYMVAQNLGHLFYAPQLSLSAHEIIREMDERIAESPTRVGFVGSSLGGFFAAYLAEKHGLAAALINPAVPPVLPLEQWIGPHRHLYTGETLNLTLKHVEELQGLSAVKFSGRARLWMLAEAGDAVVHYQDALAFYTGARQTVLPGGDHSFTRWRDYLPAVVSWALAQKSHKAGD